MVRDISQATTHPETVKPSSAVSRWSMDDSDLTDGVFGVWDDFEDGNVSEWNVSKGLRIKTNRTYSGSYSFGWENSSYDSTYLLAERNFEQDVREVELYFQEANSSYGGFYELFNSSGDRVAGFGTSNPEWVYLDGNGGGQILYSGDGYNRWIRVKITYDPSTEEVTYVFEDMNSGTQESVTTGTVNNGPFTNIKLVNTGNASSFADRSSSGGVAYGQYIQWTDNISTDISGSKINDAWGSNDGELNGGVTTSVSGVGGGEAFRFGGSDQSVDCGSDQSLGGFSEVTYSAWVRFNDTSDNPVFGKFEPNEDYLVYLDDTAADSGRNNVITYIFEDNNGSRDRVEGYEAIQTGKWYHIACVHTGSQAKIYINGLLDNSINTSVLPSANSSDNLFLGLWKGSANLNGDIDEARIYSSALTQQQIWKLYNIGRNANWGYSRS